MEPITMWNANKHVECPCGGKYTLKNKSIHFKKSIHLQWLQGKVTLDGWALFASDYIVPEELLKRYNKFYQHGDYDPNVFIGDFERMVINDGDCVNDKAKGEALQKIGFNAFKVKHYLQPGCPIMAWSLLGFSEQHNYFNEYALNAIKIKTHSLFEDIECFLKEMYPNIDFE
jgi:hypothetical protein